MYKSTIKGFGLPVILLIVAVIAVVGGGYYLSKNPQLTKNINLTPPVPLTTYQELESALNKTTEAKTAYIDYKTKVASHIAVATSGVTQTINANVDGYLTGSTDGKVSKGELRISSPDNPGTSVVVSVISLENGSLYVKGPATVGKWQYISKEEGEKLDEKNPTDASLYGFNFLESVLSENKALFRTIKKDSVEKLEDHASDGKNYKRFTVEIAVPDYISAIEQDPDATLKDKSDAKKILSDATVKVTFHVDKSSNYITKLVISAKNLSQIKVPEAERLGISTTHDMTLDADISRFDVPTDIKAPEPTEVINPPSEI